MAMPPHATRRFEVGGRQMAPSGWIKPLNPLNRPPDTRALL
jgi:hypothetical protein